MGRCTWSCLAVSALDDQERMAVRSSLVGLVFSKDRAMQLDAALRSFRLHCSDADQVKLRVLYHASSQTHARQYAALIEEHRGFTNITFQRQARFRADVLVFLAENAGLRAGLGLYRRMAHLHRRLGFFSQPLLRFDGAHYVLFLVDDNLFVGRFCLADALSALEQDPQAIGFSLRLGQNITHCYTRDLPQPLPPFTERGERVLRFDWTRAALDFAYPLEVSSSIYRISDLLPRLNRQRFANPNQMESRLAESAERFAGRRPFLLCFPRSVAFSNPVNQVAERYWNRFGMLHPCTSQELAERFAQNFRIDIEAYAGLVPQGCHQEVALKFCRLERGADAG
jgi:hypothetical protein